MMKKFLALLCTALLLFSLSACGGGSVDDTLKIVEKAINRQDFHQLMDAYHPYCRERMEHDEKLKESFDEYIELTKHEFGPDYKVTLRVAQEESYDTEETSEIYSQAIDNEFHSYTEKHPVTVEKTTMVYFAAKGEGDGHSKEVEYEIPFEMFRIDGRWYLSHMGHGGGMLVN